MNGNRLATVLRRASTASGHAAQPADEHDERDIDDVIDVNSPAIDNGTHVDATEATASSGDDAVTTAGSYDVAENAGQPDVDEDAHDASETDAELGPDNSRPRSLRFPIAAGVAMTVATASLAGWLGYQDHQQHQDAHRRALLVQGAKQGALNLTNIDYHHVDSDVQRILDGSIGSFHDEFQGRLAPFTDFIKTAKSISQGEVAAAGLESIHRDEARVAVALNVKTYTGAQAEPQQRAWRMRITVRDTGNDTVKVSNVEFVP